MTGPVVLVVNPLSAAGRTGRRLHELEDLAKAAFGAAEVRATVGRGDGRRLAMEAVEEGAELVIAVGGDGTANEVVDGIMTVGARHTAFALVPAGTGSDLAKTLGMPKKWSDAIDAIRQSTAVPTDVLRGTFSQPDGSTRGRYGINVIGVGMAGEVVRRVNEGSKALGGQITFLAATVRTMLAWRAPEVSFKWTDEHGVEGTWNGKLTNAFIANGRYCGGGMLVGPKSTMRDGLLDIIVIPDMPVTRLIANTSGLYNGQIAKTPGVLSMRVKKFSATTRGRFVPCDIDGEQPGGLAMEVEVLRDALRVRAPGNP